ncbi:hypothetical protein [Streptomyces coelicoflavus]|uniref:hypothetical protein n=1 Tax=Streptomyces coelicoflavus TaxID=285562 RepID=UPI003A83A84A
MRARDMVGRSGAGEDRRPVSRPASPQRGHAPSHPLLGLQQAAGNTAVVHMLEQGDDRSRAGRRAGPDGAVAVQRAPKRAHSPESEDSRKRPKASHEPASAPQARREAIQSAVNSAHALVAEAMTKVEDDDFLRTVFGPQAVAATVKGNYKKVLDRLALAWEATPGAPMEVVDGYREGEKTSVFAFTQKGRITATTRFHEVDDRHRRDTLVHEAVHAALGTPDIAYNSSRLIDQLSTKGALQNPDSYVWYAVGVLEGRTQGGAGRQVQDDFGEGPQLREDQRKAVRRGLGIAVQVINEAHRLLDQAKAAGADPERFAGLTRPVLYQVAAVRSEHGIPAPKDEKDAIDKLGKIAGFLLPLTGSLATAVRVRADSTASAVTCVRGDGGQLTITVPPETAVQNLDHATLLGACLKGAYPKNHAFLTALARRLGEGPGFTDLTNFQQPAS